MYKIGDTIEISNEDCTITKVKNNKDLAEPKYINSQKITAIGSQTGCIRQCLVATYSQSQLIDS